MKAPHKVISLLLGTILLLLTLGIPVYQVHCACNGSTEVSLLVTPEICEDQHNQCCSDQHESQHCDADALVVNSQHHCDNVQINYLVFDEIQDVVAPPAIIKSTFTPIAILLLAIWDDKQVHSQPLLPESDIAIAPPAKLNKTSFFLSLICQRKIPACA